MKKALGLIALLLPLALAQACTTPGGDEPDQELHDEDLHQQMPWNELLERQQGHRAAHDERDPQAAARLPQLPLAADLGRLAVAHGVANPRHYEGGLYGVVGSAKLYLSSTERIPDSARLYWVMVKVLSEKYGCFMAAKVDVGERTFVRCRDGRQVAFWRAQGPGWIQFYARQYDPQGYEIVVRDHQMIRVGRDRVF